MGDKRLTTMLQKYYKLFLFGIICTLLGLSQACTYPYYTTQARKQRQQDRHFKQYQKAEAKKADVLADNDTSNLKKNKANKVVAGENKVVSKTGKLGAKEQPDSLNQGIRDDSLLVQNDSIPVDSSKLVLNDSLKNDSLQLVNSDSLPPAATDSLQPKVIQFSPDSLAGPLQYEAKDSMIYDLTNKRVLLYGEAEVIYENYELKAGYIELNFNTYIATAEGLEDSTGKRRQEPFFNDGNQKFNARKIAYNFKSKKGKVFDASTEQGDGYFLSGATKFVSSEADSTSENDVVYAGNCIYTTCNHKHPHFGIRSSKAKVIPNKLIVVGPSYVEIMGTPTPIVLPFGFFPITKTRKSGLILSTDFDNSATLGLGILGMGYYQAINDFIDLKLTGDFYTRGTVRLRLQSRYNWRYKGAGSVSLNYARTKIDERGTPDFSLRQDFNFSWNHNQASKAHPHQTFNASVNFGTSDYYQTVSTQADLALQSTLQSNISYTRRFPRSPFSLAIGASHSQNTSSPEMRITLPRTTLTMNQIFPFQRKQVQGESKWYERIGFSYNVTANNELTIVDSLLFSPDGLRDALDEARYRVTHSPRVNMSFKLFDYINIQPNINYREYWYFYSNEQRFNDNILIEFDTTFTPEGAVVDITADTTFGERENFRYYGFNMVRDFSAGVNVNTQFFATGTFNVLGLHKLRAIIRPTVGVSWRPDYSTDFWGYYNDVQVDTRYPDSVLTYQRFDVTPGSGQQALINYSLNMRMEGKLWRNKKDTTSKDPHRKIVVLNNLSINGNYNVAADSLKMSVINLNANTKLFKKIDLNVSFTFDPYIADINSNTRLDVYEWAANKRLARMTSANVRVSTALNKNTFKDIFKPNANTAQSTRKQKQQNKEFEFFQGFNVSYNFRVNRSYIEGIDSLNVVANELSLSGGLNLSKGWNIRIRRIGYDFDENRLTYPDLSFSRNLHCWEMGVDWQPERKTWRFYIQVRPGSLGFFKVPVQQTQFDPF